MGEREPMDPDDRVFLWTVGLLVGGMLALPMMGMIIVVVAQIVEGSC